MRNDGNDLLMSCYREYFKHDFFRSPPCVTRCRVPGSVPGRSTQVSAVRLRSPRHSTSQRRAGTDFGRVSTWILVLSRLLVGSWCWSLVPPLRLLSACPCGCRAARLDWRRWRLVAWSRGPVGDRRSWTSGACCGPGVIRFSRVFRSPPSHVGRTAHHSPALVREVNMKRQMSYK